jgi:hypothetical protein
MPNKFGRERLGIWDESKADTVIAPGLWSEGNIEDAPDNNDIVLSVEVSNDQQVATVALATGDDQGRTYVKVLHQDQGFDWVPELIGQIQAARNVKAIVCDSSGAVLALMPVLNKAKIKTSLLTTEEVKAACSGFLAEIHAKKVIHTDDEATKLVVTSAGKRPIGQSGAWAWKRTSHDVAPLQALTWAHYYWNKLLLKPKLPNKPARLIPLPL